MTHFLRFPDADAWTAAATEAGFYSEPRALPRPITSRYEPVTPPDEAWQPNTLIAYTHDRAIDVVGTIPELDGWHVNFAGELPDGWDEFLVTPAAPYRVFA
jgi:hypothetical protein